MIHSTLSAGSFTERHLMNCGYSVIIEGLGYPTWNPAVIYKHAEMGYARVHGDNSNRQKLIYYAPECINTTDTVIVICARATQITCDTGYYIFEVTCARTGPIDISLHALKCNDTLIVENLNAFQIPEIEMTPTHGQAKILYYPTDGAALWYVPNKNYEGPDYVKVKLRTGRTWLYIINVRCKETNSIIENLKDDDLIYHFLNQQLTVSSSSEIIRIQFYTLDGKELDYELTAINDNQVSIKFSHQYSGLVLGSIRTEKGIKNIKILI